MLSTEVYIIQLLGIRQHRSIFFLAPFEIIIGGLFLYQSVGTFIPILFYLFQFSFDLCRLLGPSAFAGFIVLLAGWPLNSFIARRNIRIQKGVLAARDKRMGVLDELIRAVCTFFFHLILQLYIHYLCVIMTGQIC